MQAEHLGQQLEEANAALAHDVFVQMYGVDTKRLWNEDPGCSRVHDVCGPPRALGPRAAPDRQEKSTAAPGVDQTPPKLLEPGGHCERRGCGYR